MAKFDVYEMVAQRIIDQLEQGIIPWEQPWYGAPDGAYSHKTGKTYSLLNQMLLGDDHEYVTMSEIKSAKGHLNKGSKSKQVVFWKIYDKDTHETDDNGDPIVHRFAILRYYNVFDIADTDLKPRSRKTGTAEEVPEAEDVITEYITRTGVRMSRNHVSNQAYYMPSTDCIVVPELDQYENASQYYSTVFHEMTHSTGHKSRLNRLDGTAAFGGDDYSKEELVAELGAASLVNICGLECDKSFRNSTAYIQNWLGALKNDKKLIVSASGRAQKAVDYILNRQDEQNTTPEPEPEQVAIGEQYSFA